MRESERDRKRVRERKTGRATRKRVNGTERDSEIGDEERGRCRE